MDTGIMELDKLIHSFEFENQQYVKMIEKESQLITSLESQIQDNIQVTTRLEEEIGRFDEDTKRLHRLYTNNRDNIDNLKSTINVLSDHEVALTKQLEITQAKTEENRKFYKTHITNYSSTRDDYMNKYARFPLAIELDRKKCDLAEVQSKLDSVMKVKQDLKERIAAQESELDSKVMTRIVVKIAKTKLATLRLENEIHQCLAEKTDLVEKLKEIRTSQQPEQEEPCAQDYDGDNSSDNMITGNTSSDSMEACKEHVSSIDVERLSCISISNDHEKYSSIDVDQQGKDDDEMHFRKREIIYTGNKSQIYQEVMDPDMSVESSNISVLLAQNSNNKQQIFRSGDTFSANSDLNNPLVSHHHNGHDIGIQQSHTQIPSALPALTSNKPLQKARTEDYSANLVSNSTSLKKTVATTPTLKQVTDYQQLRKQPVQMSTDNTYNLKSISTTDCETPMHPSLRVSRLCVPKPPRVLPPPVVRIPPKLSELRVLPESFSEIKRPIAPPSNMLKDFRQKLNLLTPRPQLHSSERQQNHFSSVLKTSALSSTMSESGQAEHDLELHKSSNTKLPQFQTWTPQSSTAVSLPRKVQGTLPSSNQIGSSVEEFSMGKQNSALDHRTGTMQKDMRESTAAASTQETDVEVATGISHDISPTSSENCQTTFKVNVTGSHSPGTHLHSPKRNYSKSPTRGKSSQSKSNHGFLFESLFGNFEKNSNNEASNENDYDEGAPPTSIFSLFNISQNPSSGNAGEDPADSGSFLTFGKFTNETGSPSSDGGPRSLLNLFSKSPNSESYANEFAINLHGDTGQEEDKDDKRGAFKFGETSYFKCGRNYETEEEEGEKPLFNLF